MHNQQINAFASGRDPEHAVICVTTGTIEKLNKHEFLNFDFDYAGSKVIKIA